MQPIIFPTGDSPAITFAARELERLGLSVVQTLQNDVTHVLLPVPTKEIPQFPENVTLIGGNLNTVTQSKIDLLKNEYYLGENAALTADCTLRLLGQRLDVPFQNCPMLIIGWGRIGKILARMLKNLDARVAVAARKPADLGMLNALGYDAVALGDIREENYRVILNTAPAPVLAGCGDEACIRIDLASRLGISGENVLWARGLPGKMLPRASGALIAKTVAAILQGVAK